MATLTGSVQLGAQRAHRRATPIGQSRRTRTSRTRTCAGDSVKETFTDIGKKKFDLNNTSWRKGGMESEKVDGPVTRLWKFFFRPNDGYVDRYGFSVPMGPLDDVSAYLSPSSQLSCLKILSCAERHALVCDLFERWLVQRTYCDGCSLVYATHCR